MNAKVYFLSVILSLRGLALACAGVGEARPARSDLARLQGRWTARAGARREVRVASGDQGPRGNGNDQNAARREAAASPAK